MSAAEQRAVRRAEQEVRDCEIELKSAEQSLADAQRRLPGAKTALSRAEMHLELARVEASPCPYPGCGAQAGQHCRIENRPEFMRHTARKRPTTTEETQP